MEKKQVISRMSSESYERLQELSRQYGVSSSGLLTLLVNERWLKEKELLAVKALEKTEEEKQYSARTRKSRNRQKSRKR